MSFDPKCLPILTLLSRLLTAPSSLPKDHAICFEHIHTVEPSFSINTVHLG